MNTNFSNEHISAVFGEYGGLLCNECRDKLTTNGQPIADALNEGRRPQTRHLLKLLRSLCPVCEARIAAKKLQEARR